jgi:hypothetical protein
MAGFEHFTETYSNYTFHYYSISEQPYASLSPGQTTNHYFPELHAPTSSKCDCLKDFLHTQQVKGCS